MSVLVILSVVRENEGPACLSRNSSGRRTQKERVVGVKHVNAYSLCRAPDSWRERDRERKVRIRKSRNGRIPEDGRGRVCAASKPRGENVDAVTSILAAPPQDLDRRGHASAHREVVVSEDADPH